MRILVDADACPVKQKIIAAAKRKNIPVLMFTNYSHEICDGYSIVIKADEGKDSVDFALIAQLTKDDVVMTQDYGLAAMVISKGAKAINQYGSLYTDENIDRLLTERHINNVIRRSGGRIKSAPKRKKKDDESFEKAFENLLAKNGAADA
ncbi:MAG: YaiI/YqxD family protein [Defluviitaleaceae bacterium]|nr:YaiI/YqxD family protein [Defluviitaleaceae bacterium]